MAHAGYGSNQEGFKLKKDPRIQEIIREEMAKNASVVEMTRQKVMDGLLEAIQMARVMSDPHAMIKAWDVMARVCGFMAPEVKRIDISVTAKRLVGKLEQMSDDELLKMAEGDLARVLEGEFTDATYEVQEPRQKAQLSYDDA